MSFWSAPFTVSIPNTPEMRAYLRGEDMDEWRKKRDALDALGLIEEGDPRLRPQAVFKGAEND